MSSDESELASRGAQVSNFLVRKDKFSALQLSLKNPPINSKSEEMKVTLTKPDRSYDSTALFLRLDLIFDTA